MSRRTTHFFMKKLIIIICLLAINILSYKYLIYLNNKSEAFIYNYSDNYLLILKKDIVLDDIESFVFDDYFIINSFKTFDYDYRFDSENIYISIDDSIYHYPYSIKEKEIEEVIIYQYLLSNNNSFKQDNSNQNNISDSSYTDKTEAQIDQVIENTQQNTFNLYRSSLTYSLNTELDTIINDIYACFETDYDVEIDYSLLNTSDLGTYIVYLNYGDNSAQISIQII